MSRTLLRPRQLTMVFGVLLLLAFSIGVVSAQTGDGAQVRVVHAAPDAGEVDVYVDGEVAIEGLAYTDATDFQELPEGDHDIAVVPAGGDVADAVVETSVSLGAGDVMTFVAHGTGDSVELFEIAHDWDEPGDGMARIVLVNATSDSANVELLRDGEPVVGDGVIPFGDVATEEVEPGDYNYELQIEGETVTTLDGFMVEEGETYSIFAMGDTGNYEVVPYQDVVAAQAGTTPETTPDADMTGTPDADTTPDADMTGTPDADTTPDVDVTGTPDADTTPDVDVTGTPDADTTPGVGGGTVGTPTTGATTPTMDMDDMTPSPATGGGVPEVPATGAGGTADSAGASGWIAMALAALAIALGGGLVWRARNERPAA